MAYAFVREGTVEFIEERESLNELYHKDLLENFIPVPVELEKDICTGYLYKDGEFIEPEVMSPIANVGGYYIPKNQEKLVRYLSEQSEKKNQEFLNYVVEYTTYALKAAEMNTADNTK